MRRSGVRLGPPWRGVSKSHISFKKPTGNLYQLQNPKHVLEVNVSSPVLQRDTVVVVDAGVVATAKGIATAPTPRKGPATEREVADAIKGVKDWVAQ